MNNSRTTIIILFAVLGVLLLLFNILGGSGGNRYQWSESYKANSDQPYGTLYIKKLLDGFKPGGKLIDNNKKSLKELLDSTQLKQPANYVFIGPSLYLDVLDKEALFNFIYSGNDAFIASLELPEDLLIRVFNQECDAPIKYDSIVRYATTFNFFHDTLRTDAGYTFAYRYKTKNENYNWNYLNEETICDSTKSITPLGYFLPHYVNFFRIPYGKGNLYLHSNPLAFTNYFMRDASKADYAAGVFSHLHGKDIIWDESSKIPFTGSSNKNDSPLNFILQQPSLKYAWWILLITVLLYILFAAKRTQRIIPVLELKSNTSLEYIKLISSLHYQNGDHLDMARKKMKYFHYFIRNKYGIHTQTFSEDQIKKLAEKSKVNIDEVQAIIYQYNQIEQNASYNIEAGRLADFYTAIENFYKQCK